MDRKVSLKRGKRNKLSVPASGGEGNVHAISVHPSPLRESRATHHPTGAPPSNRQPNSPGLAWQDPLPPPPPPPTADAQACAVRALGAHVVVFNVDFVVFPAVFATLSEGPARDCFMFLVCVLNGFWMPMLFVMYNMSKLRQMVRDALGNLRDRMVLIFK